MLTILLKFAALWLVVEVALRLLDRFAKRSWRPWLLTITVSLAALGLLWV